MVIGHTINDMTDIEQSHHNIHSNTQEIKLFNIILYFASMAVKRLMNDMNKNICALGP